MEYEKQKLQWLEFDLLTPYPHVVQGTFLRHGGTSKKHFATLNLGNRSGDHVENVRVNRETVRKALDVPRILYANQVHGSQIHRIRIGKNDEKVPAGDGLFTTEKDLGLAVTHADCQAAIFYDPAHEAVGIVHCGWKGSVQNIYARMVEEMHRQLGTQPRDLLVCISPSLGPDHAEHKNYQQELPQEFWDFQVKPNCFDYWAISTKQLGEAGVLEKNIEISRVCTHCDEKNYYSYRRDKETGRHATIVALKG